MNAVGVEDGQGVVDHPPVEVVYLFPYDTDGRTNLTGAESMAVIDVLNSGLDDMSFDLAHIVVLEAD